jgi:lipoteichoic acid synthase
MVKRFKSRISGFYGLIEKHPGPILLLFLAANALKYYFVEHEIISSVPGSGVPGLMVLRFLAVIIINSAFFLAVLRLRYRIFSVIFYSLQAVYLSVHYTYWMYFKKVFPAEQFIFRFSEGVALLTHGAVPFSLKQTLILADLPLFVMLIFAYPALKIRLKNYAGLTRLLNNSVIIVVAGLCIFFSHENSPDNPLQKYSILRSSGLFAKDVTELFALKRSNTVTLGPHYVKPFVVNEKTAYPLQNIIFIQVESLDADLVNYKYKGGYITPFLHKLSSECVYYPNMTSFTDRGHTSDVELVVLNSISPSNKSAPAEFSKSLLFELGKFDYDTAAFHNNVGSFFGRDKNFPKIGFKEFFDLRKMRLKEQGWGASDGDVFNFVKGRLQAEREPFFYYVITMSSHEPFNFVGRYFHDPRFDDIERTVVKDYFNSFSYVDKCLEDLVTYAKNNLKNTYIFIIGDHPSALGFSYLFSKDFVPLFIITPDSRIYSEPGRVISTFDLAATLLFASKTSFSIESQGVNLLEHSPGKRSVSSAAVSLNGRSRGLEVNDYALQEKLIKKPANLPDKYVAHAGGVTATLNDNTYTNCREAFFMSLHSGFRLIETDLEWTSDGHIVLIHDWDGTFKRIFKKEPHVCTLDEFMNLRQEGITQMSLEDLMHWLFVLPGTTVITDVKRDNLKALQYISAQFKDLRRQIIPQIYEFGEYDKVVEAGYADIVLTLYMSDYSDEKILEFARSHRLFAVTMPVERARGNLPRRLNELGVFVYAHTVNDYNLERELSDNGVNGFYTDYLNPK